MVDTLRPIKQLLYAVRWAIILFVLVTAWKVHFSAALVQRVPIMIAVVVIAVVTLISQLVARKWQRLQNPVLALMADILLVTIVVYFSDGIQSPFYALYYITVIIAAVDFGLSGALLCATVLAAISVPVDLISPGVRFTGGAIARDLVRTIPYLFLTALITGALRRRLSLADESASSLRAERAATDREMEVAARIQRAQLPPSAPLVEGCRIAVTYKPARDVGGDLYDFYPVGSERTGFISADVSGKGVPAALLVSSCKYAVRESYSEDMGSMMAAVNEHIMSITTDETFVTMLYGTLSPKTREFRYVNAGHMPPMIVKQTGEALLCTEHSDLPLGIVDSAQYTEQLVSLDPGDTIVLYTDGVTDALAGDDIGMEALRSFLQGMAGKDIATWGDELLRRTAHPHHVDDLTVIVIRVD